MDFATRNGLPARPSGPQSTPLQGALRVHNLTTPAGFAWKTLAFSTPPLLKVYHHQRLFEINSYGNYGDSLAATFTPLLGTLSGQGGKPFLSFFHSIDEVEAKYPDTDLVRIHRHLLLRLGAVLGCQMHGKSMTVRVPTNINLPVSKSNTPKLKKLLGNL